MANKYEVALVLSVANGDEAVNALKEKFNDLIAKNGTVENVDEWGKRRLAYPIDDVNDGFYVLVNYKAEAAFVAELERNFNITDGILRSMVIAKEA